MAEKDKPKTKSTRYRVFEVTPEGRWIPLGEEETHGATAAIFGIAKKPGDYRAVPVSNITELRLVEEEPPPPRLVAQILPAAPEGPEAIASPPGTVASISSAGTGTRDEIDKLTEPVKP